MDFRHADNPVPFAKMKEDALTLQEAQRLRETLERYGPASLFLMEALGRVAGLVWDVTGRDPEAREHQLRQVIAELQHIAREALDKAESQEAAWGRLTNLVTIEPNKGVAGCGYCGNGLGSKKPGEAYSAFHRKNCPWLIAREALDAREVASQRAEEALGLLSERPQNAR